MTPEAGKSILFVDGLWVEKFGVLSLVPHLAAAGFRPRILLTRNTDKLLAEVEREQPGWVAFPVTTGYHVKALAMAAAVKRRFPRVRTVFGGPHVTYFPDIALRPEVDAAFRGECDRELPEALLDLCAGRPKEQVANLVFPEARGRDRARSGNAGERHGRPPAEEGSGDAGNGAGVRFGPLTRLEEDLDSLGFPDREVLYSRYRFFRDSPYKSFIVSRGCPHACAFCFNRALRKLYRGKGCFVRTRSPQSVVAEGKEVHERYGMRLASFEDDLLTHDAGWLERMLTEWKARVGVPYNLNGMAGDFARPETVRLLKETGAWCVAFGVETGSEALRTRLLKKPVRDEQVKEAARRLKEAGIRFHTYNMFGLPGEGLEGAVATVRLNREIGTWLARSTLFEAYPGTEIGDETAASGDAGRGEMLFGKPVRAGVRGADHAEAVQVARVQKLSLAAMRLGLPDDVVRAAARLPLGPFYTALFWASYFRVVREYMQTGTRHLLGLGIRSMTDLF
jgi:radical SAM superfamily enzyme YgiQ (UPF0313 family)